MGNVPELFIDNRRRIGWQRLGKREWQTLIGAPKTNHDNQNDLTKGSSKKQRIGWNRLDFNNRFKRREILELEPGQTREMQFDFLNSFKC